LIDGKRGWQAKEEEEFVKLLRHHRIGFYLAMFLPFMTIQEQDVGGTNKSSKERPSKPAFIHFGEDIC
jgi:hypothetical protein